MIGTTPSLLYKQEFCGCHKETRNDKLVPQIYIVVVYTYKSSPISFPSRIHMSAKGETSLAFQLLFLLLSLLHCAGRCPLRPEPSQNLAAQASCHLTM